MALLEASKVIDTVIGFLEMQRPVYDTLINTYYSDRRRRLSVFHGRRLTIPASSMPSIEVAVVGEAIEWFACRVQNETSSVEIDVSVDIAQDPENGMRLLSKLTSLTARVLASPPHLRAHILNSGQHFYDSIPGNVSYSLVNDGGGKTATISWTGKYLEYLVNNLFNPGLQIPQPVTFPPY